MKSRMLLLRVTEGWNETEEPSKAINNFLGRRWTWRCVGPRKKLWPIIQRSTASFFWLATGISRITLSLCASSHPIFLPCQWGFPFPLIQEDRLSLQRDICELLHFVGGKQAPLCTNLLNWLGRWNPVDLWAVLPIRHSFNSTVFKHHCAVIFFNWQNNNIDDRWIMIGVIIQQVALLVLAIL